VDNVLATLDQLEAGFEADIAAREARLKQSQQAAKALQGKAQKFALKAETYRLEAKLLDNQQTATTGELTEALEAVQRLGKPAATGQ